MVVSGSMWGLWSFSGVVAGTLRGRSGVALGLICRCEDPEHGPSGHAGPRHLYVGVLAHPGRADPRHDAGGGEGAAADDPPSEYIAALHRRLDDAAFEYGSGWVRPGGRQQGPGVLGSEVRVVWAARPTLVRAFAPLLLGLVVFRQRVRTRMSVSSSRSCGPLALPVRRWPSPQCIRGQTELAPSS